MRSFPNHSSGVRRTKIRRNRDGQGGPQSQDRSGTAELDFLRPGGAEPRKYRISNGRADRRDLIVEPYVHSRLRGENKGQLADSSLLRKSEISGFRLTCESRNGDVAQLAERYLCKVDVRGSIPLVSTRCFACMFMPDRYKLLL